MPFVAGAYRYKAGTAGTDIGSTDVGALIRRQNLYTPISVDEHGDTIVDGINTGAKVEVEIKALEYSQAGIAAVFPQGEGGEGEVGALLSANAVKLVMEPIRPGQKKYTFWKAVCVEPVEQILSGRAPKTIPMKFMVLPDYTKPEGQEFYKVE